MTKDQAIQSEARPYALDIRGWYRVIRGVIGFLLRLLSRFEVEGLEHLPEKGPYLVAINHLHWLDAPAVMVVLPCRAHVFAAEKWGEHWLMGPLFRSLDAIFVQRGEVDRKALRQALSVLGGGGVLGVAPEGTRSRTGAMQRGRNGAAYLAFRAGARVVPVAVSGQEKVFAELRRLRRARVHIVFAPPLDPPAAEGKPGAEEMHAFAEEIMYTLAAMLPAQYRGVYDDVAEKRPDLTARYAAIE